MSKYTFIKDFGDGTKITHEFYAETHHEVTEQYQLFMLGGGFVCMVVYSCLVCMERMGYWRSSRRSVQDDDVS